MVPMKPGCHIPSPEMFKPDNPEASNLDETLKNVAAVAGEKVPDVNIYGTKLTRMGTKNGVTNLSSDINPNSITMSLSFLEDSHSASTSFFSSDLDSTKDSVSYQYGYDDSLGPMTSALSDLSLGLSDSRYETASEADETVCSRL